MTRAVIVFKEPKLRPLPTSITPQMIREAPLPAKLVAAQ